LKNNNNHCQINSQRQIIAIFVDKIGRKVIIKAYKHYLKSKTSRKILRKRKREGLLITAAAQP